MFSQEELEIIKWAYPLVLMVITGIYKYKKIFKDGKDHNP